MRFDPEFNEDDLLSDLAELRKQGGLKGGQRFAKLVGDEVVECSLSEWVKLLEGRKGVIKQETVGDRYWVSTVFMGIDHGWSGLDARGVWFESMVFDNYGRDEQHGYRPTIYCERYSTMAEARRGHLVAVDHAQKLLAGTTE